MKFGTCKGIKLKQQSFKYLGVNINHNGKWDNQSKQVKLIGNSAFNSIIRLKNKLPNVKVN